MYDASVPFVCPWACMASTSPNPTKFATSVSTRSFAQALLNKVDVPLSHLPKPCLIGSSLSIKISENVYQSGVANCDNYLHGRLVLSRGDKPLPSKELREKISRIWNPFDLVEDDSHGSRLFLNFSSLVRKI